MSVVKLVRRVLASHRLVPLEQRAEYRKHRIKYKGGEYRLMEQRLLRQLKRDKTLAAFLKPNNFTYYFDVYVTEEAELIVVYEKERFMTRMHVNVGDPIAFNRDHRGGQFRFELFCGKWIPLSPHKTASILPNYQPKFALKAKYQY